MTHKPWHLGSLCKLAAVSVGLGVVLVPAISAPSSGTQLAPRVWARSAVPFLTEDRTSALPYVPSHIVEMPPSLPPGFLAPALKLGVPIEDLSAPSPLELPPVPPHTIELAPHFSSNLFGKLGVASKDIHVSPSNEGRTFFQKLRSVFPIILEIVAFPLVTLELLSLIWGKEAIEKTGENVAAWFYRDRPVFYAFLPLILIYIVGLAVGLPFSLLFKHNPNPFLDLVFTFLWGTAAVIVMLAALVVIVVLGYWVILTLRRGHVNGLLLVSGSLLFVIAKLLLVADTWSGE